MKKFNRIIEVELKYSLLGNYYTVTVESCKCKTLRGISMAQKYLSSYKTIDKPTLNEWREQ